MSYEVEQIIDKRINRRGRIEYLVKWKDYKDSENSWEPSQNFKGCKEMIQTFNQKFRTPQKRLSSQKESEDKTKNREIQDKKKKTQGKTSTKRRNFLGKEKSISKESSVERNSKDSKDISRSRSNEKKVNRWSKNQQEDSPFTKLNITVDIQDAKDPALKVESMFEDESGMYWYTVTGSNGRETIPKFALIKRNFMALIAFYEEHLNFKSNSE